jgi:hypothetical protein
MGKKTGEEISFVSVVVINRCEITYQGHPEQNYSYSTISHMLVAAKSLEAAQIQSYS